MSKKPTEHFLGSQEDEKKKKKKRIVRKTRTSQLKMNLSFFFFP